MRHALYFTADWCNPCKKIRPIVNEINADSIIKFQMIDVDDNEDICLNYKIKSVPTFILIEDGKEIKRLTGLTNAEKLKEFLHG
jgi:thioredoxin 1